MLVKATRGFAGWVSGRPFHAEVGQVFELPEGVNWLNEGIVVPVRGRPPKAKPDVLPDEKVETPLAEPRPRKRLKRKIKPQKEE